jgi:predicted 2-oxoglutarate/Fe(II)-dependent dioxygenase YbiX
VNPEAGGRWLPGDRLPDVRLRTGSGEGVRLHGELAGAPLWLCVLSSGDALSTLPAPPEGVNAVCIVDGQNAAAAGAWRVCTVDAGWRACLGNNVLWVTDGNLRLRECHALPLHAPPDIAAIHEAAGPPITSTVAPVLLIPGVFEPAFCTELIAHLETDCGGGEESRVLVLESGKQELVLDPSIKQRRESLPRDPTIEARMHERLQRRALPEIARVFNFQVSRRDPFKLLAYPEQAGYFRAHRDNETPDVAHRRFALSVNLNAGDYAGGEFRFPEFGPHRYSPATGGAIAFSCSLLHEVLPVSSGLRYAMTTFLA